VRFVKVVLALLLFASVSSAEILSSLNRQDSEGAGVKELSEEYLAARLGISVFGGKSFCAYELLGTALKNGMYIKYIWVTSQEYYLDKGIIKKGMEVSFPVALTARRYCNDLFITGLRYPSEKEGADAVFPEELIAGIKDSSIDTAKLDEEIQSKAREYFKR